MAIGKMHAVVTPQGSTSNPQFYFNFGVQSSVKRFAIRWHVEEEGWHLQVRTPTLLVEEFHHIILHNTSRQDLYTGYGIFSLPFN